MKPISFLLFFFIAFHCCLQAQNIFIEDFLMNPADSLENMNGWTRSGVNTSNNIKVVTPGLVYPDYSGSGRGNTCLIKNNDFGDVIHKYFPAVTKGNLYLSFMFRVDSLPSSAAQGYITCFNPNTGGTYFNTTFNIKRLSDSSFQCGVRKISQVEYANNTYFVGNTYLAVLKYAIKDGDSNDLSSIYVFESGVPTTEPNNPAASSNDGMDFTGQSSVVLTNNYAQGSMKGIDVKIDGLRLGTSWESSVLAVVSSVDNHRKKMDLLQSIQPNPAQDYVKLFLQLPEKGHLKITMQDDQGKNLQQILDEVRESGPQTIEINTGGWTPGSYICTVQFNDITLRKTLIKVK